MNDDFQSPERPVTAVADVVRISFDAEKVRVVSDDASRRHEERNREPRQNRHSSAITFPLLARHPCLCAGSTLPTASNKLTARCSERRCYH